ncbi:MAG: acetyl-CoA carboxylase biotin carboxyl carrier protein [Gemmatimonadota bacterium]|nr:acetyl-CoA carboxylase biotin carboxyl carrier protein [Gemmatimonadota bacterium]
MDFEFIERLIRALDDSSIDSIEIERGGTRVHLSKTPPAGSGPVVLSAASAAPMQAAHPAAVSASPAPNTTGAAPSEFTAAPSNLEEITSPMVGTFYRAPAPDAPAYVDIGDRIAPGDTLCIIEAMKLMNELDAEIKGKIVEVCVENAQPVEFGQVLFRVDPS